VLGHLLRQGSDFFYCWQGERERGAVAAAQLRQAIAPFFLRREKKDVFRCSTSTAYAEYACPYSGSPMLRPIMMKVHYS
jgi:hypothetical protein